MKKTILILSALLALFSHSGILRAQKDISSTVEVKREFEGRLLEISKSKLDTRYSDTLMKLNLNFDYTIFDRPYKDLYEFSPMQSAHLSREGLVRYPVLYTKLAMSYPWMPEADIFIQPKQGERFSILFYGRHHSFWGHDKKDSLGRSPENRMVNEGGMSLSYNWKRGELTADGFYSHNMYHFCFGGPDHSRTFQRAGADIRVRSVDPDPTAFYYDAKVKYNYLSDSYPETNGENRFDIDAVLGVTIQRKHKVLLGISTSNAFVNKGFEDPYYSGIFEITPQYRFDYQRWRFKAGLTVAGRYTDTVLDDSSFTSLARIYPEVSVSFEAAKNALWLYARVDGENKLASLSTHLMNNPWVDTRSSIVGDYSIPIRAELGLNGVFGDLFSYSVSGTYSRYNNYLSYVDFEKRSVSYSAKDVNAVDALAELLFKSKSFSAGANARYTYFFPDAVKNVPSFRLNVFGKYNYRERLFLEVTLNYLSGFHGGISDFVDLGAVFTFAVNSKLSIFAQGQNIINQKIMYIQNYLEPGVNFGLGIYLKL